MYFIYIIYSPSADKYYVGYTANIDKRLKDHNGQEHFSTYTSKHRPWILKALFSCGETERVAIKLEKLIKKSHSRKLVEKLVDPLFIPQGGLAQLVRVRHVRD